MPESIYDIQIFKGCSIDSLAVAIVLEEFRQQFRFLVLPLRRQTQV